MACAVICAIAATTLPAGQADARATVTGVPDPSTGELVRYTVRGLPARSSVSLTISPTLSRGGNGAGRRIFRGRRADDRGRLVARFRFPRAYVRCGGIGNCGRYSFEDGERVDLDFFAEAADGRSALARTTVRVYLD
jgi:hypothetical protein